MDGQKSRALVAASVAGLLAAAGTLWAGATAHAHMGDDTGTVPCYGINKCKGAGECGGKGHGCAGKNECAGQGYIELEKDTCLKIQGGRLTIEPEPAA